jgi:hypothetical protein
MLISGVIGSKQGLLAMGLLLSPMLLDMIQVGLALFFFSICSALLGGRSHKRIQRPRIGKAHPPRPSQLDLT